MLKKTYAIDSSAEATTKGKFTQVYEATGVHDPELRVTIKVYDKTKAHKSKGDILDAASEEVAVLHTLDHTNIAKYFETYNDKKFLYMVMEHVPGINLSEMIAQQEK